MENVFSIVDEYFCKFNMIDYKPFTRAVFLDDLHVITLFHDLYVIVECKHTDFVYRILENVRNHMHPT